MRDAAIVITPIGLDPGSVNAAEVSGRLGYDVGHFSFVATDPRQMQDTLRSLTLTETILPVFWHSLNGRAARMYPATDIAYAATASGLCCILHDPADEQAAVFEAAEVAARIIGGELRWNRPGSIAVIDSGAVPPLARAPRLALDELVALTSRALQDERGFSFIRLNHCEPRVMGFESLFTLRDVRTTTTRRQWGRDDVTAEEVRYVAHQMRKAAQRADVIGVPSFRPVVHATTLLLERSLYCLSQEPGFLPERASYVDVTVHNRLSTHPLMFELMKSARQLVLISSQECPELDAALSRTDIIRLMVPSPQATDSGHYPGRYREIMHHIEALPAKGTLVLVGAGVLGKIYCDAAKQAGAVALDIGAVFDAWAGLSTRSSYRPEMSLRRQLSGG